MNRYNIDIPLTLPEPANPRFADLTAKESDRGGRIIGGDHGDLRFNGYVVEDGTTTLADPVLLTGLDCDDDTPEELHAMADEILKFSYASIGIECVEHS